MQLRLWNEARILVSGEDALGWVKAPSRKKSTAALNVLPRRVTPVPMIMLEMHDERKRRRRVLTIPLQRERSAIVVSEMIRRANPYR